MRYYLILMLFLGSFLIAEEEVSAPSAPETVQEVKKDVIELADIPERLVAERIRVKELAKKIQNDKETADIHNALQPYVVSIDTILKQVKKVPLTHSSIRELEKKQHEWTNYLFLFQKWNKILNERIDLLEKNKQQLKQRSILWTNTLENAKALEAPEGIIKQTTKILDDITRIRQEYQKQYNLVLSDLEIINSNILKTKEFIELIKEAKEVVSGRVFQQNSLSLMELLESRPLSLTQYAHELYISLEEKIINLKAYYVEHTERFPLFFTLLFFTGLLVFYYNYLYKKDKLFVLDSSYDNRYFYFLRYPYSSFLMLTVLINIIVFNDMPQPIKELQLVLLFVPIYRIGKAVVKKRYYRLFHMFLIFSVMSFVEKYSPESDPITRLYSIFLTLFVFTFFVYFYKHRFFGIKHKKIYKMLHYGSVLVILALFVSIVADIYGATILSNNITKSICVLMYTYVVFFILQMIISGYIVITLRKRMATAHMDVAAFRDGVEKTLVAGVKLFMVLWWIVIGLKLIGVYPYVTEFFSYIINISWEIGQVKVSLKSFLDFVFILLITWFLVKVINIFLNIEVFARIKFPRGVPTVITTVLNYTITIVGVLIAFFSLGVTLEQMSFVFGALGVGIGFGLRNIIANFVSGIIMVFERPIQIGDTVQIDDAFGTVEAIKTRASVIRTFDGAEVIVPNADFISKEIVNWTLNDENRRKTIEFRVDLQSDIDKVLQIMQEVAQEHKDVLPEPKPMATLVEFGEYYLEFKLYFWLRENLIAAHSEITIELYKRLQKEGISMAMPKQEILRDTAE